MKKLHYSFLLVWVAGLLCIAQLQAQTPSKDFFAGKWEISVAGTPRGDVTLLTELVRKDGRLTGELVDPVDPANGTRKITKVEESGNKLSIYFDSPQAGEMAIDLGKVDNDYLTGTLYTFEAKARRLK